MSIGHEIAIERTIGIIEVVLGLSLFYVFYRKEGAKQSIRPGYVSSELTFRSTLASFKWRVLVCTMIVTTLFFLSLQIESPTTLGIFVPPAIVAYVAERWSILNIIYGIFMITFLYFIAAPFLQKPIKTPIVSKVEKVSSVAGIVFGLITLALVSGMGFFFWGLLLLIPVAIGICIEIFRRVTTQNHRLHIIAILLQRSFYSTIFILWPSVFVPVSSTFTLILIIGAIYMFPLTLIYKTIWRSVLLVSE